MKRSFQLVAIFMVLISCTKKEFKTIGSIERIDPELNSLIYENARIEILDYGFDWTEGPVWVESQNMLLFSDIPKNHL